MKDLLLSYARYEQWANAALLGVARLLNEEQLHREIVSSFPSVHSTWMHMWGASNIWWQRLQHQPVVPIAQNADIPFETIAQGLLVSNARWAEWMERASETQLVEPLHYQTLRGQPFSQSVVDVVLHLNNHGTYHRGQLVTMYRQLGVETIPQTDYILFSRKG